MAESLRDQLLKAGLVTQKQAKRAARDRRKDGAAQRAESAEIARRKLSEKQARDRALNEARNEAAGRKSVEAKCLQLIEAHRRDPGQGDIAHHFVDNGKVRRVLVTSELHAMLVAGQLAIVRAAGRYELVDAAIAEQLRGQSPDWVLPPARHETADAEHEYPEHPIPDDLMW